MKCEKREKERESTEEGRQGSSSRLVAVVVNGAQPQQLIHHKLLVDVFLQKPTELGQLGQQFVQPVEHLLMTGS
jgi:hypothetical protein